MRVSIKRSNSGPVNAGPGFPTCIMAMVGMAHAIDYDTQFRKVDALMGMSEPPEIIGDLSIVCVQDPLWARIVKAGFATATLPIYTASRNNNLIDAQELLDIALRQIEGGVGLLTIHPTPTRELIAGSKSRLVPWTSRGGGLVIKDLLTSSYIDNVYLRILPDLATAASRHGVVLSLGASFRSANIFDSLDGTQCAEIERQLAIASDLEKAGVEVVIESPGHSRPSDIKKCAQILSKSGYPIMPLGPIPTDTAIGWDHVAGAIGATIMGIEGAAHILAAVTREEHTGKIPSLESTLEAVYSARIAAHLIDIHLLGKVDDDWAIAKSRADSNTCIAGKQSSGCGRCRETCPLEG